MLDNRTMKEMLPSLPTRQLVDLGDDLNMYGRTDEDFTLLELIVIELQKRSDVRFLPYWAFN